MRRSHRVVVAGGTLVLAVLGACGEDEGSEEGTDGAGKGRAEQAGGKGRNPAVAGDPTLTVHMTGLLLFVPPVQTNGSVEVLLPEDPETTEHFARVAFGIDPTSQHVNTLCKHDPVFPDPPAESGICYVDLREWQMSALGGDARPADVELPAHILNVTQVAGARHKILPATIQAKRRVSLAAGWAGPNSCSLANWTHIPVNAAEEFQNPKRELLANVIRWEIRNPSPNLTFIRGPDTISVPLLTNGPPGHFEIILANVPASDLGHLPPGHPPTTMPTANPADSAKHFHRYFDLLREPANPPRPIPPASARRGIPHNPAQVTLRACPVGITGTGVPLFDQPVAAISTYACMPGSGERGS